jgi:hypothetical protein
MIEASFDIGPKTERLRQSLMAPFSLVISPGEDSDRFAVIGDVEVIPRCKQCGAYYSNFAVKTEDSWTCPICGCRNEGAIPDNFPQEQDIEVVINDPVNSEIMVLYLALDFHPTDLEAIKPGILAFLKLLTDRPLVVLLGHSDTVFAALCPYERFYSFVDGVATFTFEGSPDLTEAPAPVLLLNDLSAIDFSSLIFPPSQIHRIMQTVRNLQHVPVAIPFAQVENVIATTARLMRLNLVHFITVVPVVGHISKKFAPIVHQPFRLDFVTPQFNSQAVQSMSELPGTVSFFGRKNLFRHLKCLIRSRTIYQVYQRFRARGVSPSWRRLSNPITNDDEQLLFSPVVVDPHQPSVLDLIPNGKSDNAFVQITSKMIKWSPSENRHVMILRVLTRSIKLCDKLSEIVASVNAKTLMWLWLTRTMDQEVSRVIAGLFRGVAGILKELSDDDPKVTPLVNSICSLKYLDIVSSDEQVRIVARAALCLTPPRAVAFCPEYDGENKMVVAGFTVYVDGEGSEAALNAYNSILYGSRILKTVPEWCKAVDGKSFEFLESLLND